MPTQIILLIGSGVLAGVVGSSGGITSLVSYPALLLAGVPPVPANVANLMAGVAMGPGSAFTSRRELVGSGPALKQLLPAVAIGTVIGSGLLLITPPGVFARLVPFLVLAGSALLLLQPALTRLREGGPTDSTMGAAAAVGAVSIYGGYFGAGSGVMLLAVVLVLVDARMPSANAIKNLLVAATALCAAAVFLLVGSVPWAAILPLAAGLLVGSAIGPVLVRRVPAWAVRYFAAALGVVLAVLLWLGLL